MGYSHPHVLPICRLKAHLLMVKPHIIDTKVTMHPIYSPYFCCLQQISTVFFPIHDGQIHTDAHNYWKKRTFMESPMVKIDWKHIDGEYWCKNPMIEYWLSYWINTKI